MEGELSRAKIILQQNEAVSEETTREIMRLREQNEILKERLFCGYVDDSHDKQREIMSIKVLTDAGSQTVASNTIDIGNPEEFPVHIQ